MVGGAIEWSRSDGHDVHEPSDVDAQRLLIPRRASGCRGAGARGRRRRAPARRRCAQLLIADPADDGIPHAPQPRDTLDLLAYGSPHRSTSTRPHPTARSTT